MMHYRCSGSCHERTPVGTGRRPCSCVGLFYGNDQNNYNNNNSFSMLFPAGDYSAHHRHPHDKLTDHNNYYLESSFSSVDCTLSLGTPSTRLRSDNKKHSNNSGRVSNFCLDMIHDQSKKYSSHKSSRGGASCNSGSSTTADTLLSRRCANCDTTSTPLWRNGPKGPKSLCNACGIRFKKEEKRASTATISVAGGTSSGAPAGAAGAQQHHHHQQYSLSSQNQKTTSSSSSYKINEFKFFDDSSANSAGNINPYLSSWRLNVTGRPAGLVHEFTR